MQQSVAQRLGFAAGELDLSAIYAAYVDERGFPPYDPRLMLKLLVYRYATGTPSSRSLEERTHTDVAVRFLCADQHPDFRPIARFRRRHLDALAELFVQALRLCRQAGLVGLGTLALDGTKLRANASRRKAMSYLSGCAEDGRAVPGRSRRTAGCLDAAAPA
jgi:transposase